jgi:hypothetical protein
MTVWRWLGALVCMLGLMVLIGGNLSATAQDKDKAAKDSADKKDTPVKDAPAKDTPAKDTPAKDTPAKDTPAKDAPAKDAPAKDAGKKEEPKVEAGKVLLVWKAFEPKTIFYQELTTKTQQDMKVMGQEISQKQDQTFYLKWTAEDKTKDGNYVVKQEILELKMNINIGGNNISYDSTEEKQPQNPMTDFFKALKTLNLKLTVSPKMEATNIEGQEDFVKKLGATNPQMEPLLKNILSKEALQQMAEPTWGALPDHAVAKGETWSNAKKPNVLKLGPIGTYTTTFTYTYEGEDPKTKLDKITIKSELKYAKPEEKSGLPFTIKDATLASKEGSGVALFDRAKGRFVETTMKMRLEGELTIEVGGMDTKVTLTQNQDAVSKTSDEEPAAIKKKK